jgi:hypothetical protein
MVDLCIIYMFFKERTIRKKMIFLASLVCITLALNVDLVFVLITTIEECGVKLYSLT